MSSTDNEHFCVPFSTTISTVESGSPEDIIGIRAQVTVTKLDEIWDGLLRSAKFYQLNALFEQPQGTLILSDGTQPKLTQSGEQLEQFLRVISQKIIDYLNGLVVNQSELMFYRRVLFSRALSKIEAVTTQTIFPSLSKNTTQALQKIYQTIVDDTSWLYQTAQINTNTHAATQYASISGSTHANEIIQAIDQESGSYQVIQNIREKTTIQDIYSIVCTVLGFTGKQFPEDGLVTARQLLELTDTNKNNLITQYLPVGDVKKLNQVIQRSEHPEQTDSPDHAQVYAVLDGIHLSWVGVQPLIASWRIERPAYSPYPVTILRKFHELKKELTKQGVFNPEKIDQFALMGAVLEVVKDLIYLEDPKKALSTFLEVILTPTTPVSPSA